MTKISIVPTFCIILKLSDYICMDATSSTDYVCLIILPSSDEESLSSFWKFRKLRKSSAIVGRC